MSLKFAEYVEQFGFKSVLTGPDSGEVVETIAGTTTTVARFTATELTDCTDDLVQHCWDDCSRPVSRSSKPNKLGDHCRKCGHYCEPGKGVEYVESNLDDELETLVECRDEHDCTARKLAREARKASRKQRLRAVDQLAELFSSDRSVEEPTGEKITLSPTVSAVIAEGKIWYLCRNSSDGDDFTLNTVASTWIGRSAPRTVALEAAVRALSA